MELLRTPGKSVMELWRLLSVYCVFVIAVSLKGVGGTCDDILLASGGMSAVQVFLPRKIDMHDKCGELLENGNGQCSEGCNEAVTQFSQGNGNWEDRIFFTCECSESSNVYRSSECERDRNILVRCPYLMKFMTTTPTVSIISIPEEKTSKSSRPTEVTSTTTTAPPTQALGKDCRRARLDCRQTFGCARAFDGVKDNCLEEFRRDGKCSEQCKKSLETLETWRASKYLWGCECDPKSEETTWCDMYRRQDGLQTACEGVVYKDLGKTGAVTKDDPGGTGTHRASVTVLISVIIPLCTLLGLVS